MASKPGHFARRRALLGEVVLEDDPHTATRDVAAALACFAPGVKFVGPMGPVPVPDGVRAYLGGYRQSFPDSGFDITNIVKAGDRSPSKASGSVGERLDILRWSAKLVTHLAHHTGGVRYSKPVAKAITHISASLLQLEAS